jgi:hypothetical protein
MVPHQLGKPIITVSYAATFATVSVKAGLRPSSNSFLATFVVLE